MENDCCYIAERVICTSKQEVHFEGTLTLEPKPCHPSGALSLLSATVTHIQQISEPDWRCCEVPLEITLLCHVCDVFGQHTSAVGRICLKIRSLNCIGNLRYGADLCLINSHFCGCGTFSLSATVRILIVASKCEIVCNIGNSHPKCQPLPLYPHLPQKRNEPPEYCRI